jgi:threonyl-tRNA synthetase
MLTRIYGVAFETVEELKEYEENLREAEKRDHKKIGKELDLFTFSDKVGAGLPLFTPKGTIIRDAITNKISKLQKKMGWQKIVTPHITKKELYETSGHSEKFGDELFKVKGKGENEFVMKPMNCPHHTQVFASSPKTYRDLPVRYSENGIVYRDEQSGELSGLSRVRHITQDDGHAFVTPEQVESEIKNIISIIKSFYTDLGMLEDGNY